MSLAKLNLLEKAETSTNRKQILHIKFDGAAGILRLNERSNDYLNVMNFHLDAALRDFINFALKFSSYLMTNGVELQDIPDKTF